VIRSFGDKALERFFATGDGRRHIISSCSLGHAPACVHCQNSSRFLRLLPAPIVNRIASFAESDSTNVRLEKRGGQSTMMEHPRISLAPDVLANLSFAGRGFLSNS
jgi:hypothetical protein